MDTAIATTAPTADGWPTGSARSAALSPGTTPSPGTTLPRRAALVAAAGYVILFAFAIFANFFVIEELTVPGDAAATAESIMANLDLFRLGVAAFLVIFLVDVVVAWALHIVFREVHRDVSLVTAWLRLAYTVMLGVALMPLMEVLHLLGGDAATTGFSASEAAAQAMLHLDAFGNAWLIGLVAFGVHLVLLGWLVVRSGRAPKLLGRILMVAGGAYALDTLATVLVPAYDDLATVFLVLVAVPSVIAEGWMALWLLRHGGEDTASPRSAPVH